MIFQQLINDEAGCLSYLIGCGRAGAAVVVGPGRDRVSDYVALARRKGLTVTHVVETHVHADHISGNQALAAQTGATIYIHAAAEAKYRHLPVKHGNELRVGSVSLRVLHTPGHIPDSISHLPMREAVTRRDVLPPDRPKAVLCAGGLRSSTVISVLERSGTRGPWYNVTGGMTTWLKAGNPVVR